MISTVIMAFVSFISTNIDDIFILMLFFSQVDHVMKRQHIVIGQYLGIGTLTTLSIIGALGISLIPYEYVGILGLIPIYLGIKTYLDYKKESKDQEYTEQKEFQNDQISFTKSYINPSVIKVFSVTFANGGDNIGVYIPLFAHMSLLNILITVIIFLLLIALWCFFGMKLAERPFVRGNIEKYEHIFVPILFIGLGFYILMQSGTIRYIFSI